MCAIFGIFDAQKATELTVIGLHVLQHRASDYAGIVSCDGQHFYDKHGKGLARQVFTKDVINRLHGKSALGHIRYPTVTDNGRRYNVQPIVGIYNGAPIAVAHNGNLTNVGELHKLLTGSKFATSMDTELVLRLLEKYDTGDIEADLVKVFAKLEGSYSLGILLPDRLIAVRDKSGNRPLSIGKVGEGYCLSSETCALPNVGATYVQDVEAGTMVTLCGDGLRIKRFAAACEKKCRFEHIYYSHPASTVFGEGVSSFRMKVGEALERLFPVVGADIVTSIPDSANCFAIGFGRSGRSGIYFPVIHRSHYGGRSFIAATQALRDAKVEQKFTFAADEIKGKIIVVADDSIVRFTTIPKIVARLRQLSAKEVHIRIGSPPILHPCSYGIHTPTYSELIATHLSPMDMCEQIGADSLEFLPLEVLKALSPNPASFCFACMDGKYW